jgi:hypothetical protein
MRTAEWVDIARPLIVPEKRLAGGRGLHAGWGFLPIRRALEPVAVGLGVSGALLVR